MIKGIIFDFDGLILDTEGPIFQSWVEMFQDQGTELTLEDWASVIGRSSDEHFDPFKLLEDKTGRVLPRETLLPRRYRREIDLCESQPILPGVVDTIILAKNRRLKLGVASSSKREWVVQHLERLGLLPYFQVIHTADDVKRTKPDPELFDLTLNSLNLKPEEAIVFEDSPNGVTAAKAAGIFVVAIPNPLTKQLPLDHADMVIRSLADTSLDDILRKIDQNGPNI